jgi:hypothetical protein
MTSKTTREPNWSGIDRFVRENLTTFGGAVYGWAKVAEMPEPTARLFISEQCDPEVFPLTISGIRVLVTRTPPYKVPRSFRPPTNQRRKW